MFEFFFPFVWQKKVVFWRFLWHCVEMGLSKILPDSSGENNMKNKA